MKSVVKKDAITRKNIKYPILMEHLGEIPNGVGDAGWKGMIVSFSCESRLVVLYNPTELGIILFKELPAYVHSPCWTEFKGSIEFSND